MNLSSSLDAICATALDAVVAVSQEGHIIGFNAQAEELFGYPREAAIGQPMAALIVPPRHRAGHEAGMHRFQTTGVRKLVGGKVEIEALHAEGHEIPVELGLSVLEMGGETIFLSFMRDLTSRHQHEQEIREARERAERANAAKSFVVSMLAHDMRNALGGVTGGLVLLDRGPMTQIEADLLAGIETSARDMARLLNDTIDFARIEDGELEINPRSIALEEVGAELERSWAPRIAASGGHLGVSIAPDAPAWIKADPVRLRQALGNLLSNADKYAPGAGVTARFEALGAEGLRISISDSGPGFSEEALETAFDPFARPSGQRQEGVGLGLAIVKTLTESMGGNILLASVPNGGAHFTLTFDNVRKANPGPATPPADMALSFDRCAVLLVEDNATNRLIAIRMLEKLGCDVTACEDGLSGVETAENIGFDAILMDIDLPKLDGKSAIRRIRSGHGPNVATPITAFTAFALRSQREEILAAGADDVLAKPVSGVEDFARALQPILSAKTKAPREISPDADTNAAILDSTRLRSLCDTLGQPDFLELADEFRRDLTMISDGLASTTSDFDTLKRVSHMAIGVTGALGGQRCQQSAERLNHAAHHFGEAEVEARRKELHGAIQEMSGALDQFLEAC